MKWTEKISRLINLINLFQCEESRYTVYALIRLPNKTIITEIWGNGDQEIWKLHHEN